MGWGSPDTPRRWIASVSPRLTTVMMIFAPAFSSTIPSAPRSHVKMRERHGVAGIKTHPGVHVSFVTTFVDVHCTRSASAAHTAGTNSA